MGFKSELRGFILHFKVPAQYTLGDLLVNLEAALAPIREPERLGMLVDASLAENFRSLDEILGLLPALAQWQQRLVGIAVVVGNDTHFGITNQLAVYGEDLGLDIKPFQHARAAEAWLKQQLRAAHAVAASVNTLNMTGKSLETGEPDQQL